MTTAGEPQTPRNEGCSFDIRTSMPLFGYKEIGTIDVNPGAYETNVFKELSGFKEHIAPNVCELGGDTAIALVNGSGMYIKATVLKRIRGTAPVPAQPVAGGAPVQAPKKHGCDFDTQCKGERICVDGRCQAPALPTVAPEPVAAASSASGGPAAPPVKVAAPAVPTPSSAH